MAEAMADWERDRAERAEVARDSAQQARDGAQAALEVAEAEVQFWTAGGPLARAWRAFLHRRGRT
jgi:hypothetical protein